MDNKEFYINEKENTIQLYLNEKIYNLTVVKKALYNFIEDGYFILDYDNTDKIIAKIYLKNSDIDKNVFIKELYNELFNESLRYDVMIQTKNIRELILGRALYSTCIDTDEDRYEECDKCNDKVIDNNTKNDYNIDNIAVNWFEGNREV